MAKRRLVHDRHGTAVAELEPPRHLTRAELRELGRQRHEDVPRHELAAWEPPADRESPVDVLARNNEPRLAELVPIRMGRMLEDPFAFLRGSAVVMADDLATTAVSDIHVQVCGDMHLVNLGLFATPERNLVFDVNDFDETLPGPWEWDLKRLATSFVVAGRVNGLDADACATAAQRVGASYRTRMGELAELTTLERRYVRIDVDDATAVLSSADVDKATRKKVASRAEKVIAKARSRDRYQAFDKYTALVDGKRVIVPDPPLVQPIDDPEQVDRVQQFLTSYRTTLPDHVRVLLDGYQYVETALKVVGVGSVGTRAFMGLFASTANQDPLFLQVKEAGPSVLSPHVGRSVYPNQGQRVVEGQRLLQAASDIFLGWGTANGREYYVRQLRDMKGGADPNRMNAGMLAAYADLCGATVANAHARSIEPEILVGYLGTNDHADVAMRDFAVAYADQTERDHATLAKAVAKGKVEAVAGV